jgi:hypothetical protein
VPSLRTKVLRIPDKRISINTYTPQNKPYSADEVATLLSILKSGRRSWNEIATLMKQHGYNRSANAYQHYKEKHFSNIKVGKTQRWTEEEIQKLLELYRSGVCLLKIAQTLNRSYDAITCKLRQFDKRRRNQNVYKSRIKR